MKLLFLTALLAFSAIGCDQEGPPTIRYGHEGCARCRMIVNDDRFAAAVDLQSGDTLKFDDICCLIEYLADKPDHAKRIWVRGYQSGQWHDARTAYFAYGSKLQTPMGSGLAAVATQSEADALVAEWGGKLLRYDDLPGFLTVKR